MLHQPTNRRRRRNTKACIRSTTREQDLDINKFRYETLATVSQLFETNFFFITFDLKSGYRHVPIAPAHKGYLGFSRKLNGRAHWFQFTVLPFGLASACYAFTKILRPLVKKWRGEVKKCVIYLDDGIFGDHGYKTVEHIANAVQADLLQAGLTINGRKSQFVPAQEGILLGFTINTRQMLFSVLAQKLEKLKHSLNAVHTRRFATTKEISRIAGQIKIKIRK